MGEVVVVLLVVCTVVSGEALWEDAAKLELAAASRLSRDWRITLGASCARGGADRYWRRHEAGVADGEKRTAAYISLSHIPVKF